MATGGSAGNGAEEPLHFCRFDDNHTFTTLDARLSHEPSCPRNPDRVDEWNNPER